MQICILNLPPFCADNKRMAVHVICPSLRCRKVLTFGDEVRGSNVTCRYCEMQFRVPQVRKPVQNPRGATPTGARVNAK